jgi:ABC-type nitrate/sulfonate/bicarbonate transport system substrate-binding protein
MRAQTKKILAIGVLGQSLWLLSAVTGVREVRAAAAGKSQMQVSFGSTAGSFAPLWIAKDKGFFDDLGLDVEVIYARSVTGIQSMLAGETQAAYTGCTEIMTSRKSGSDLVVIGSSANYNIYTIASRPDIKDPKQLIGKRVAVNQLGDTSYLSAQFALKQGGIDPQSVTYVQVGNTPARLAALEAGSVEAALQSAQNVSVVKKLGMHILIDLFAQRLPYCSSGVGVSKAYLRSHYQTMEAFMRGLGKGNAFVREGNPDEVKAVMAKYMRSSPQDKRLISAYEFYGKQFNSRELQMNPEGIRFIIEQMALKDKSWLEWKPEQFYDDSIIKKLDKEGYWDAVYKQLR